MFFLEKSNARWLKEHFSHTYPDTMYYLLIDGEFKGVAVGKLCRYTIEIEDIQVDLLAEEAFSRREEIFKAIRVMCGTNTSIWLYCGSIQSWKVERNTVYAFFSNAMLYMTFQPV